MKKSIKIAMAGTVVLLASILVQAEDPVETYLLCQKGVAGSCVYNPMDGPGYECLIPPTPLNNGDCSGMVEVIIPE